MNNEILAKLGAVGVHAAQSYYGLGLHSSEIEELLRPLLGPPRDLWRAEREGLITRQELISFVGAHLHTFLRHRTGRRWPEPDPLMQNSTELSKRLEAALFAAE